jgi:hypothetical protein
MNRQASGVDLGIRVTLLGAFLAAVPAGVSAKQPALQCGSHTEGSVVTGTRSAQSSGKRPVVLDESESTDTATRATSFHITVRQGRQQLLELEQTIAADGSGSGAIRFGQAFKGIKESSLTTDGRTAVAVIDGKRTNPFPLGAAPTSIRFEDGSRLPRVHVRSSIRKTLLKIAARANGDCPAPAAAQAAPHMPREGGHANLPDDSFDCVECQGKCAVAWQACCAATFSNPVGAALALGSAIAGKKTCFELSEDCLKDCHSGGGPCCPSKCGESCLEANAVCCGPDSNGFTGGCAPGTTCADPSNDVCCASDAGDVCGQGCCARGDHCSHFTCCPAGSGESCGSLGCCDSPNGKCFVSNNPESGEETGRVCCDHDPCGENTCCPADSVCLGPDLCCKRADLCNGVCCPAPSVCLGDGECCSDAAHMCGDHCCSGFQQCCNGQCCNGICVAGVCCPSANRVCGNTCCPDGYACTDPAAQTCEPCPDGGQGCAHVPGNPMCCPSADQCCGNGECCGDGMQCCGTPPSCQPAFQCVH